MKKIFVLFVAMLITFSMVSIVGYAEEVEDVKDVDEELVTEPETEEITFLDRCEEFLELHHGAVLGGSATAIIIAIIIVFLRIKPKLSDIINNLIKIKKTTGENADVQDKQSGAINDLLDGVAELGEQIKELRTLKDTAERFVSIQKDLSALAKVLDTVYSNSVALPQGTKNMVHTLCAEVMRIAENEIYGSEVKTDEHKTEG